MTQTAETFRVFWQPGCSSCLKAKEFLSAHGISFDSINVLADETGLRDLQALGAQSVPVVSRGSDFVFAQSLRDLADFVGVDHGGPALSVADLVRRVDRVMSVALSHVRQLPEEQFATVLPGRDRTYLDLAYHIFVIPEAFLVSARGGTLAFEMFERRPPDDVTDGAAVASYGDSLGRDLQRWWEETGQGDQLPETCSTYYGDQSVHDLLERTAWHAAQHTRQLEAVLKTLGLDVADSLTEADLEGLPLPNHVYDDQVQLNSSPLT